MFALFPRGQNVTILARTWVPSMDVGAIMQKMGGGGHHEAGSVTLKKTTFGKAKAKLLDVLNDNPPKPYRVRTLMSTPVHTVSPKEILEKVQGDFEQRNISGAPVKKDGQLAGMVSKRDIRKASQNNRAHLPVSSCMIHKVETIDPDASLIRALEQMMAIFLSKSVDRGSG
ncbi:MAG: CBS domain-containing protein [Myxococcota bacterium]|nr:CBS domain-containing protein [Myxococcota bacterium]